MTGVISGPLRKRGSHDWARDPLDWYVEPEWCSERLFDRVKFTGQIHDPACGGGNIVNAARRKGLCAFGYDIVKRADGFGVVDFFKSNGLVDNIVSNPPFSRADEFLELALDRAQHTVALLLPLTWLAGLKRSTRLEKTPLSDVLVLTPRPSMPPGQYLLDGGSRGSGTKDFAWFIWEHGYSDAPIVGWMRRNR